MAYGDLTTLADVKAWLQTGQNPFPATDDALLQRLISAASEFIQNWLGRQIVSADWLEIRDGPGGDWRQRFRRRLHLHPDRAGGARLCLYPSAAERDRHLHRRLCHNASRH